MAEISYRRHSLSAGDHPACSLALLALHAELSRRRRTPRRAGARHLLRNRPVLGAEIRTGDRATASPLPSAAQQSLAPRRDGGSDRWRADVPSTTRARSSTCWFSADATVA